MQTNPHVNRYWGIKKEQNYDSRGTSHHLWFGTYNYRPLIFVAHRICNKDCIPLLPVVLTNLSVCIYAFFIFLLNDFVDSSVSLFFPWPDKAPHIHLQQPSQRLVHLQRLPRGGNPGLAEQET
jgi:hypothetical protein